ncbi:MAG: aminotransferase class I/II-fold pyridoxal phosphate-dependent enzyme [Eubacteriales bacterium]
MQFQKLTKPQLEEQLKGMKDEYDAIKAKGLKLDMSRGKPGAEQLDISLDVLDEVNSKSSVKASDGTDCRNYGLLDGIPEFKALYAELLEVNPNNIITCGNSSLRIMFDYISQCMTHGAGSTPWMLQGKIKFACPAPGYDRHFSILEYFGIEMINVPMLSDGPDMDIIEKLIKDSTVKGFFCVPKYSNPEGKTFSDEVVRRIAALKPAALDFRIIWDNAYSEHDLYETGDKLLNIFTECEKQGSEDMIIEVASTSKISFPGAGVSVLVASDNNIIAIKKRMSMQTIGYDKLNQLRHARYFKNAQGVKMHMKRQALVLAPKFKIVLDTLEKELGGKGIAHWNSPNGGYFISLDVLEGCAKRTVDLCKQAGVVLTPAGATFPYGKDPKDSNIRIAPTFPLVEELKVAVGLLCLSVKIAAIEKILED